MYPHICVCQLIIQVYVACSRYISNQSGPFRHIKCLPLICSLVFKMYCGKTYIRILDSLTNTLFRNILVKMIATFLLRTCNLDPNTLLALPYKTSSVYYNKVDILILNTKPSLAYLGLRWSNFKIVPCGCVLSTEHRASSKQ